MSDGHRFLDLLLKKDILKEGFEVGVLYNIVFEFIFDFEAEVTTKFLGFIQKSSDYSDTSGFEQISLSQGSGFNVAAGLHPLITAEICLNIHWIQGHLC